MDTAITRTTALVIGFGLVFSITGGILTIVAVGAVIVGAGEFALWHLLLPVASVVGATATVIGTARAGQEITEKIDEQYQEREPLVDRMEDNGMDEIDIESVD